MSQITEKITELLTKLETEVLTGIEDFEALLSDISAKAEFDSGNSESTVDLLKEYVEVLAKTEQEKYTITLSKFKAVEEAIKNIVKIDSGNVFGQEILSKYVYSLNEFVPEEVITREIDTIKQRIARLVNVSPKERVRMLNAIKPTLQNVNTTYKNAVYDVSAVLKMFASEIENNLAKMYPHPMLFNLHHPVRRPAGHPD